MVNELKLKVAEAIQDDVNKGIVRIDSSFMHQLGIRPGDIIEIKSGKVQGYIEDGIHIFKGIPYAEPPIGDLRFSPPVHKKRGTAVSSDASE